MKRVIIDGYNLVHMLGKALSPQTLSLVREKLEQKLHRYAAKHKTKVILVYDGQGVLGSSEKQGYLDIIFTASGESADAYIKSLIDKAHSHNLLIVSSDRSIRDYARVSGLKSASSEEFLSWLSESEPKSKQAHGATASRKKHDEKKPATLSEHEVEEWKKLFGA
ncbi:MAG: NYN domain-containing protein [Candidatus Thermochlorobacter sp.]